MNKITNITVCKNQICPTCGAICTKTITGLDGITSYKVNDREKFHSEIKRLQHLEATEFYHGFGLAIACLIRDYDRPEIAKYIMTGTGITIETLEKAECDSYDLDVIKKALLP